MIESSRLTRYNVEGTLSIVLLVLCSFRPGSAAAQPRCDQAKDRIYRIVSTSSSHVPDSLETLLDLAAFVRECQDEVSLDLQLWLLIDEVFALDGLGRYTEASAKVDHFFEAYFDDATDLYRARFYLWQLHFDALSGNAIGMVVAYNEAKAYAGALSAVREAHLHLDGAYAYREINRVYSQ